jgi:hypothetical protein
MLSGLLLDAFRHVVGSLFHCKTTEDTSEYVGKLFQLFKPLLAGYVQRLRQSSNCLCRILASQLSPRTSAFSQ